MIRQGNSMPSLMTPQHSWNAIIMHHCKVEITACNERAEKVPYPPRSCPKSEAKLGIAVERCIAGTNYERRMDYAVPHSSAGRRSAAVRWRVRDLPRLPLTKLPFCGKPREAWVR
jgi:hypothetical protein